MKSASYLNLLLLSFCLMLFAAPAQAQKPSSKYRPFPAHGFEYKPLKDFLDVPVNPQKKNAGVIGNFSAEKGPSVKTDGNQRFIFNPTCTVFKIIPKAATSSGKSGSGSLSGRIKASKPKQDFGKDYVTLVAGSALRKDEFNLVEPEISSIKAKGIQGKLERISTFIVVEEGGLDIIFDVYTFQLPDYKIVFVWEYPAEKKLAKKWSKAIEKSMKSFRTNLDEIEVSSVRKVNSESSYEDLLEYHQNEVEQTPGWRLVETPSKQFLIKTNKDNDKLIQEVIARLEASRRLFEEDYPPSTPINSVSVVRLCATKKEFQAFSGIMEDGVGGYFSPRSEDLVLFFGDENKALTLGIMTHEGFHQYCHFLFNRSPAHQWFDEGHGDYYGAWKMKGKKLVPGKDMDGKGARRPLLKQMLREDSMPSLKRHIRLDHEAWQSGSLKSYSQSFGLIYFLREGERGHVDKKYWKEEYAQILANYTKSLSQGYQEAYQEIKENAEVQLQAMQTAGAKFEELESARQRIVRPWDFLGIDMPRRTLEIRGDAMEASWGKIDELEFEDRWLAYLENEL